jgi:acetylornithine deacetylase
MQESATLELTEQLIKIPSISGDERAVCERMESELRRRGWDPIRIPVSPDRWSIFAALGDPKIVYSTHLDVVPAESALFIPRYDGTRLTGRGACDAKGVAAAMLAAAENLKADGKSNFGLLFVVGEEVDGIGAKRAREFLSQAGIRWIVNGEPTEGKIMRGHKGHLGVEIACSGQACHSGYPHLGIDANKKLITIASRLLGASWGSDPDLGSGTINVGVIEGGKAWNVVSPHAALRCIVRTVEPRNLSSEERLQQLVGEEGTIKILANADPVRLETFPEFESDVAAFGTDIPSFGSLAEHYVLYGPGSIHVAHTDRESITVEDLVGATKGYQQLYELITGRIAATSDSLKLCN